MIILDGRQMTEKEALHAHLKEKLSLPEHYGRNLDALNDCLGERREGELVVIQPAEPFLEGCGPYAAQTLLVFANNGMQVLLD